MENKQNTLKVYQNTPQNKSWCQFLFAAEKKAKKLNEQRKHITDAWKKNFHANKEKKQFFG